MSQTKSETASALVTGASGFVGAHLCRELAKSGWQVVGAARTPPGPDVIPGIVHAHLPLLTDRKKWQTALTSVRCVVHLAARVHTTESDSSALAAFQTVNVEGSRFVAEQSVRAGVRRFVFLSSIKVNGEGGTAQPYRAEDVPSPSDGYAKSKLEAELTLRDICREAGMELVIIRPPLVYGPGVRANFRRLLRLAALGLPLPVGSIENRRSMIGVENLASFIECCGTHPGAADRTWLISDGEDVSTPQLLRKLRQLMHRPDRLFSFPPSWLRRIGRVAGLGAEVDRLCDSLLVDASPASALLNWRPPMPLEAGLARTVEAYRTGGRG